MKVQQLARRRQESREGNRFYTRRDMAIIKLDQSIENSRRKRGESKPKDGYEYIAVCCGVEGCFIHGSSERVPPEQKKSVHFRHGKGNKS